MCGLLDIQNSYAKLTTDNTDKRQFVQVIGKLKVNGQKDQLLRDRAHTSRLLQHATS